jgi:hypothetical protein
MKKIFSIVILLTFLFFTLLIIIISTVGIETNKFNNFVSKKINQTNNKINLELNTIKFKLDVKEISLFLETIDPQINYRNTAIPAKTIRVYINFVSLIKSEPKIKKIYLILQQLDIQQLKKISVTLKPSNFKSFLNNKINEGKINTELSIYFDNNNLMQNFIARGSVSDLKTEITSNINLKKTNFNFIVDKDDVLLKNILSEAGPIKIKNGDLKLKLSPEIFLETNFETSLKYNSKSTIHKNFIKNYKYAEYLSQLNTKLNNYFSINFDKTYKVKKYKYNSNGSILEADFDFKKPFKNYFLDEKITQLSFANSKIKTSFSSEKNTINISGKYSTNKDNLLSFSLENIFDKDLLKLKLDIDYKKPINLDFINYKKPQDSVATVSLNLEKKKNSIEIKKLNLIEKDNSILVEEINFNKNKFLSFKKIVVKTSKNGKKNNDFKISYKKNISIKGSQFDASNLPKFLNQKMDKNNLRHINKNIEIDFTNIIAPLSENIKNFKLIGKIEKGKFVKISSKGDFGENNFLDITMKKDPNNQKKYLEIYSDLTRPLLTEYKFFNGLTGGKLLYSSTIDGEKSNSILKIENFNVINAPGMIKLLSLADLSGLADLAEGEGLSFDTLEINMEKNGNTLKLNEILALGPSISVLMEGYQDPTITSLRGTLIPAKSLNKMISKIPLLGNIIIPKEAGEGLFGISFKMKGPPGEIKTSINPIRTVTPRFIQKIIDRNKKSK